MTYDGRKGCAIKNVIESRTLEQVRARGPGVLQFKLEHMRSRSLPAECGVPKQR